MIAIFFPLQNVIRVEKRVGFICVISLVLFFFLRTSSLACLYIHSPGQCSQGRLPFLVNDNKAGMSAGPVSP